jgi:hypothetical protein
MLAGTGEINLTGILSRFGVTENADELSRKLTAWATRAGWVFSGVVSLGLLPFLLPKRLMRSGLRPGRTIERVVFWVATRALVVGLPLVLFAFLARENISQYNEKRTQLSWFDIGRARETRFWNQVRDEHQRGKEPGKTIWEAVLADPGYRKFRDEQTDDERKHAREANATSQPDEPDAWVMPYVLSPQTMTDEANLINEHMGLGMRLWYILDCWHGGRDNQVRQIVDRLAKARQQREAIFQHLNDWIAPQVEEDSKHESWVAVTKSISSTLPSASKPIDNSDTTSARRSAGHWLPRCFRRSGPRTNCVATSRPGRASRCRTRPRSRLLHRYGRMGWATFDKQWISCQRRQTRRKMFGCCSRTSSQDTRTFARRQQSCSGTSTVRTDG